MFWTICQVLFASLFTYITVKYFIALRKQKQWEAQGVVFSGPFAFFTDTLRLLKYLKKNPSEMFLTKLLEEFGKDVPPKIGLILFGVPAVTFTSADNLDELFITKNAFYTKHPLKRQGSRPFLKESMAMLDTDDPSYKKKRKALSTAFLKSKLEIIATITKKTALKFFAEVQKKSPENIVEFGEFTSECQTHIIVSILLGPDHSFQKLTHVDLETGASEDLSIAGFLDKMISDTFLRMNKNPLLKINPKFADNEIFTVDKRHFANVRAIRGWIATIIEDKKIQRQQGKGAQQGDSDIISLLLQDESYQEVEDIVDDVITMIFAGSKPIQSTVVNFVLTMLHEEEEYKRLRAEIDPVMARMGDNIVENMTLEVIEDLDYLQMSYKESMRRDAPAPQSHLSCMTRDLSIGGVDLRKDDAFIISLQNISMDPKQWREPNLFKPERFDPKSEWYQRADGGKRSPFAFVPFLGGVRVCLGKTFAEMVLKLTIPLWFNFFDFELVKPEHKKQRPVYGALAIKPVEVPLKLTTRVKFSQ